MFSSLQQAMSAELGSRSPGKTRSVIAVSTIKNIEKDRTSFVCRCHVFSLEVVPTLLRFAMMFLSVIGYGLGRSQIL